MHWHLKANMKPNANILFRIIAKVRSKIINLRIKSCRKIPIIINNFNRLDYLKQLLEWLERAGYRNIYIIDNNSSYAPLLEFYNYTRHTVFSLNKNVGHLALWKTHIYLYFQNIFYVYTDPDILPVEECPCDILLYFKAVLEKFPNIHKVGFSLKIDDIPDYYPLKEQVLKWESKYWEKQIETELYSAPIDTTFALYRPNIKGDWQLNAIRTAGKYIARHLPWYINPSNISEEEKYFQEHATSASSWYIKDRYS